MAISEEECIEALQEAAETLGKSPSRPAYEDLGFSPSTYTIMNKLGGWNRAKSMAGLDIVEPTGGGLKGIRSKPDDIELPEGYNWEELTAQQRWYYKNKERRIAVKNGRKRELRRWLYELKRNQYSCDICSEGDPPCIDFHHIGEKKNDISRMVNFGYSRETIISEIEKCVPLCANCHHKHHNGNSTQDIPYEETVDQSEVLGHFPKKSNFSKIGYRKKLRSWLRSYKETLGGCERCLEDEPVCLEFHHINQNEKNISISTLIDYNPSKDLLMDEIQSCTILCRNCHRKEHYSIPAPFS